MFTEKLTEINKAELRSSDGYKYVITAYGDITQIDYCEMVDKQYKIKSTWDIPSCHDIQIAENIIKLRKAFKEE